MRTGCGVLAIAGAIDPEALARLVLDPEIVADRVELGVLFPPFAEDPLGAIGACHAPPYATPGETDGWMIERRVSIGSGLANRRARGSVSLLVQVSGRICRPDQYIASRGMKKSAWAPAPNLQVSVIARNDADWIISVNGRDHGLCPGCGIRLLSRHSSYLRTLRDLPAQGTPVSVHARLTRWQCRNDLCERRIFTERLPGLAAPFARRTARLSSIVRLFEHSAGGRPAERLMCRLGMPLGYATILRHVKRSAWSQIDPAAIRVAGVDDWAWRKGTTYGTVIVNLERRQVVDLLPDRSAVSTAKWRKAHPEIEIVSRHRAGLYAAGAREGAPQARQVADRFHLLQNFREAVERQLGQFGAPIREAPIGKARREGAVLAATDEPATRQSAPQGLAQRCKGSDAFEYRNAARLAGRANRQALFNKSGSSTMPERRSRSSPGKSVSDGRASTGCACSSCRCGLPLCPRRNQLQLTTKPSSCAAGQRE